MPSIAKILGLILLGIGPLGAAGQTYPASGTTQGWPDSPPLVRPNWSQANTNQQLGQRGYPSPPATVPARPEPSPVVQAAYSAPQPIPPAYAPATGAIGQGMTPPASQAPQDRLSPSPSAPTGSPESSQAGKPIPLAPPKDRKPVPLPGPSAKGSKIVGNAGLGALATTGGALGVVLGLFLLMAWLMRRAAPRGTGALPNEAFEILGRAPLANRQQVHLLRCGRKLLLVSVTQVGAETLTEITDPVEVDRLAGLCQQTKPGSSTSTFRQVFQQLGQGNDLDDLPEEDNAYLPDRRGGRSRANWEGMDV
ncbi:MAG: flagellar biosynthetic protein FliO [Pirellulales bacterium]|nr:flagellar biosynthetic protein FliO [Pirellulales bacterium]